jgi:hypothetical protein
VTWANSEYGRVIVLEDDVRAGPQLLEFLNHNLSEHQKNTKIAHVNGYNLVPKEYLSNPDHASRLSIYPESYAWATWDRAWKKYDDDMSWAKNASLGDIKKICGSTVGALRWKQNFSDAAAERIDTWAYRWLASMWEHDWLMVSPNRNISTYQGREGGTHTRKKVRFVEPPCENMPSQSLLNNTMQADLAADFWLKKNIFSQNLRGLVFGMLVSLILHFDSRLRANRSKT